MDFESEIEKSKWRIPKFHLKSRNSNRYRRRVFADFCFPFVYGLATANFLALLQFVTIEKVTSSKTGLFGLVIISVSVPALLGYAVYTERILATKAAQEKLSPRFVSSILTLSLLGVALSIGALSQIVGVVFFVATAIAIEELQRATSKR